MQEKLLKSTFNLKHTMKCRFSTIACTALFVVPMTMQPLHADTLKERQVKITAAVASSKPAVVCLRGANANGMGSGSGVVVSKEGLVLTATHVVDAISDADDKDSEVTVILPNGTEVKGKVLGRDRTRDAAMVQITTPGEYAFAPLATADSIEQGEWCLAMGHPGSFDIQRGIPVRAGRLWKNNDKAFYRSDCTVSGGDSGGPLFDLDGKVIGIHSSISTDIAENRHVPIGVFHEEWERLKKGDVWGNAKRVLSGSEDLREKKAAKKAAEKDASGEASNAPREASATVWLGMVVRPAPGEAEVMVVELMDGSPAQKAGIQVGDRILKINGKDITSTDEVAGKVKSGAVGDKLKFTIKRAGENKELEATLAARPAK